MQLKGLVALVTGAGNGIGKAITEAYAREGADLALVDIDPVSLGAVAKMASDKGCNVTAIEADLGDVASINAMVDKALAHVGRIDVLVNNAGVTRKAFIMDITEEDWDRIHRINAKGLFFAMQRVAREMMERDGGRIINMASIAGKGFRDSSNVAYAGSKGAVIAMTRMTALQLGSYGVRVNAICPGVTMTPLIESLIQQQADREGQTVAEVSEKFFKTIPLKIPNEPEDIAAMAVFLAGPGGRTITGQTYNIDGGLIPD